MNELTSNVINSVISINAESENNNFIVHDDVNCNCIINNDSAKENIILIKNEIENEAYLSYTNTQTFNDNIKFSAKAELDDSRFNVFDSDINI